MMVNVKNEMQRHLWKEFSYSHRIDVEPTPSSSVSWDEMHQRLRKINFDINKKYLKTSYFPKWKLEDRFWFVGSREGGAGTGSEIHYHLLLHTPSHHRIDVWNDIVWGWMQGSPIIYSHKGAVRKSTYVPHKDKFHLSCEVVGWKSLINVEPIRNVRGSMIYATKKLDRKMENTQGFISII
jgi:hypothetical protein